MRLPAALWLPPDAAPTEGQMRPVLGLGQFRVLNPVLPGTLLINYWVLKGSRAVTIGSLEA